MKTCEVMNPKIQSASKLKFKQGNYKWLKSIRWSISIYNYFVKWKVVKLWIQRYKPLQNSSLKKTITNDWSHCWSISRYNMFLVLVTENCVLEPKSNVLGNRFLNFLLETYSLGRFLLVPVLPYTVYDQLYFFSNAKVSHLSLQAKS